MLGEEYRRSALRTGGGSFVVTLPKKWCNLMELKAEDFLLINLFRNSLIITKVMDHKKSNFEIDIDNLEFPNDDEYLKQIIVGAYVVGYHTITLRTKRPPIDKSIVNTTKWFIRRAKGPKIVELDDKKIVIQDFLHTEVPIEKVIESMMVVLKAMILDTCDALITKNLNAIEGDEGVIHSDDELDSDHWLLYRQTSQSLINIIPSTKMEYSRSSMMQRYLVSQALEKAGDYSIRIAQQVAIIIKSNAKVPDESQLESIRDAANISLNLLENGIEAYNMKEARKALVMTHEILNKLSDLDDFCNSILEKVIMHEEVKIAVPLSSIIDSIYNIGKLSTDISMATINMIIKEELERGEIVTGFWEDQK